MNLRNIILLSMCFGVLYAANSVYADASIDVHAKQDGHLTVWLTSFGIPIWKVFDDDIKYCKHFKAFCPAPFSDFKATLPCDTTGKTSTSSIFAPYYDTINNQWSMYESAEWESMLGLTSENSLQMPGLNSDSQDLYIAVDMLAWQAGNGTYTITGDPEPIRYYQFTNGICSELPGVFLSTEPLTWNPSAPETDPYHGYSSADWYTTTSNEVYVCHEFAVAVPEPTTMALLGLGGLTMIRRRRSS